jgi:hypothetical protein
MTQGDINELEWRNPAKDVARAARSVWQQAGYALDRTESDDAHDGVDAQFRASVPGLCNIAERISNVLSSLTKRLRSGPWAATAVAE